MRKILLRLIKYNLVLKKFKRKIQELLKLTEDVEDNPGHLIELYKNEANVKTKGEYIIKSIERSYSKLTKKMTEEKRKLLEEALHQVLQNAEDTIQEL